MIDTEEYISECAHPLLLAFSVLTNGRKLLHISKHTTSKEQVETFHGLRVISMMWIVAGHGMVAWDDAAVTNAQTVAAVSHTQILHEIA